MSDPPSIVEYMSEIDALSVSDDQQDPDLDVVLVPLAAGGADL